MALVAYLQAATGRLDRLVATAERLGSDQWMPVVALARTALAAERRDLALEVFAASNGTTLPRGARSSPASRHPTATSAQSARPGRAGNAAARLATPNSAG
jgi:hypothetical protein